MLSLDVDPSRIPGPWRFAGGAWCSGASAVRPYAHRALESFAIDAPGECLIVVRENPRPGRNGRRIKSGEGEAQLLERLLEWPFAIQIVCLPKSGRSVTVATGEISTAPLFLAPSAGRLVADWDAAALYRHIPFGELNFERTAYVLCHLSLPYSRRTVFASIQHLTERARAEWDPASGRLEIVYPEPAPEPEPRALRPGADPVAAFETLFAAIVRRAVPDGGEPLAVELSGGLDSGVAAIVAAGALGPGRLLSFGLLLPGPQQRAQQARREAVAGALGIADRAVAAEPPFSRADVPAIPWGEYYREAFDDLAVAIGEAGCARVLRGFGGDEISELYWDEQQPGPEAEARGPADPAPDYLTEAARAAAAAAPDAFDPAPGGVAATSFHDSAAAGGPGYLRRGIWPIHPYGTPELVRFCRSLPREWRAGRTLQRRILERHAMASFVVRPDPPESFLPLRDLMFRPPCADRVRRLFADPLLARLGLVDGPRLADSFHRAAADPELPGRTRLMEAAGLESILRAWRGASAPLGP